MASQVPVLRQISWHLFIPQFFIMCLVYYGYSKIDFGDPFYMTAFTWIILIYLLRYSIAGKHRKGIKLVKQFRFREAIPFFEQSYEYFTINSWVDKYRFLTMLSVSKMSYRESALCNLAFCYSQTGDGIKAKEYYEKTLKEFPESGLAKAALNMLNSVGQNSEARE